MSPVDSKGVRRKVPWWARIALKIVLARLPVPYRWWKQIHLFEHGTMDRPAEAVKTVLVHARTAGLVDDSGSAPRLIARPGFTMLEIGPGDSLASGVAAYALGAERSILVDTGDFASRDLQLYRDLVEHLGARGYRAPIAEARESVDSVLVAAGVTYLTHGVDSLAGLPAASVDFCFSNAVMEHVPKADFERMAREMARVLRPDGVCVHRVDFQDHLGGGLNNLRFSERVWEGRLFADSGFYTNRIRPRAMCALFEAAGLTCEVARELRWPAMPIQRAALDERFRRLSDDDLLVYGMDLRLRHAMNG